jgi:phosphoserine phosphatase RsbX
MDPTSALPPDFIEYGVAARPLPGETVSGDKHVVAAVPGGVLVAVIDGLGHGVEAAQAAEAAAAVVAAHASEDLIPLMRRCHAALAATRGVAMSLVSLKAAGGTATWLGVGNVEAVLVRTGGATAHVMTRGGIVGYQLPPLRDAAVPVGPGDMLVMASDGIVGDFVAELASYDTPQRIADRILALYARDNDDALVLVARRARAA